ncbi:hypothetical protein H6F61_07835 [Cyanobacteria bacterium FACHB-472]|nr:hypothetical protein [Cyanobacteria bacterium FACHB-472]
MVQLQVTLWEKFGNVKNCCFAPISPPHELRASPPIVRKTIAIQGSHVLWGTARRTSTNYSPPPQLGTSTTHSSMPQFAS